MRPALFHIGGVPISSFWVTAFLGFLAAFVVTRGGLRRRGYNPDVVYDLLICTYIGGWIGARLALIPTAWDVFVEDPIVFLLSGSGWMWYGGLLGGAAAVGWWAWRRRFSLRVLGDILAPALAIGQAIGRIGCQLSGDGDYGTPTTLPWGMSYPEGLVPTTERVHPTPIYEFIGLLALFLYLQRRSRTAPPAGDLLGRYFVGAASLRFLIEFVRRNPIGPLGLTEAQWVSIGLFVVGIVVLRTAPAAPDPARGRTD
jgi:phosphatidylglycerol:prolipoprotein diacylglycerol transferase